MAGLELCHPNRHWRLGLRRKTLCGFPAVPRCSRDKAFAVASRADLAVFARPFSVWCAAARCAPRKSLSISPETLTWRSPTATAQMRRASILGRRFAESR
jgi:hypothetical protein